MAGPLTGLRARPAEDEATIAVVPGDGAGPALVASACAIVDAAVKKAYGDRRAIAWVESALPPPELPELPYPPEELVDIVRSGGAALLGPTRRAPGQREPSLAVRAALDLYAEVVTLPGGPIVIAEALENEALPIDIGPNDAVTADVLAALDERLPESLGQLRFASRVRADAYRRFKQLPATTSAESGLGIALASRQGTQRLVITALRIAKELGKKRITVVHDTAHRPATDGGLLEWAYRVAEEELGSEVLFSFREYARIANRGAPQAAEDERATAEKNGVPMLDDRELGEILRTGSLDGLELVLATGRAAAMLLDVASAWTKANPASASVNPETGLAIADAPRFGADDAGADHLVALVAAGASLLRWFAWDDAAQKLDAALAKVTPKPGADATKFADAVTAAL